jgi:hypothetical protein
LEASAARAFPESPRRLRQIQQPARRKGRRKPKRKGLQVRFCGRTRPLKVNRIVFALAHGRWPEHDIDHKNRTKADDRPTNLRDATHGQNLQNRDLQANNTSGVAGVHWHKKTGKWIARIDVDGRRRHLGCFATRDEAEWARLSAQAILHSFAMPEPVEPTIPHAMFCTEAWRFDGRWRCHAYRFS